MKTRNDINIHETHNIHDTHNTLEISVGFPCDEFSNMYKQIPNLVEIDVRGESPRGSTECSECSDPSQVRWKPHPNELTN